MSYVNFFVRGALQSKGNAKHWFRYLRKMIVDGKIVLPSEDISALLKNDNLTMFQKITLERAATVGSPTFMYAASLNQPAKYRFYEALRSEMNDRG